MRVRPSPWTVIGLLAAAACDGEPPVAPRVPAAILIAASDTLTAPNNQLRFAATVMDSQGQVVDGKPVAWAVSDSMRGRITATGEFVGGPYVGRLYVRATVAEHGLADSVAVRIVPPGTVKWTWAAAGVGGEMPNLGGPALASDGTVYVLVMTGFFPDYPGTVVAFAPEGAVRWTRPLLHVALSNGVVVTPSSERLWVAGKALYLIAPTGEVLWDTLTITANPSFRGGAATASLLVANQGQEVVVYGAEDHALLWRGPYAPLTDWLVPPTITADGRILAKRTADTLFVFDAADGTVLRTLLDPDTAVDKRVFGVGSVPAGGRYYLPTVNRLAAFDTAGALLWLTDWTARGMTEPAVGPDGTLFVQNRRWGLQAINPDGSTRWYRSRFIAPSGPWSERPRWPWHGGLALAQGGVLYGAGFDRFFAYDVEGTLLWEHVADSAGIPQAFIGSPAIAPDGTVYTFTSTHLYAFWGSAPPEPNSPWPMWRHDAQRTGWAGYKAN